ncbi:hypothetical protein BT96DRAFT_950876 [Gymnopus androsaceus JB14]|uniref:Uncharacterized protein n=1 Tax=Gymnopus androsaceus JB14 TaxID=1447944 RepID=A0A6A4GEX7_9AGAR|nr:hypothetical protein BT96DRAFT_950876 [Gymnopus androsaceus JB14]
MSTHLYQKRVVALSESALHKNSSIQSQLDDLVKSLQELSATADLAGVEGAYSLTNHCTTLAESMGDSIHTVNKKLFAIRMLAFIANTQTEFQANFSNNQLILEVLTSITTESCNIGVQAGGYEQDMGAHVENTDCAAYNRAHDDEAGFGGYILCIPGSVGRFLYLVGVFSWVGSFGLTLTEPILTYPRASMPILLSLTFTILNTRIFRIEFEDGRFILGCITPHNGLQRL